VPPAPDERISIAAPVAVGRLLGLMEAGSGAVEGMVRGDLLVEWLTLAGARGLRVPPELLPALLDTGRRQPELRPLLLATGGDRARWLATLRPEWRYLTEFSDESLGEDPAAWSAGTPGQRVGYLQVVRRRDAAAGRELLREQWGSLPPDERAQLIEVLATGLEPADEEFLEAALDDRRREVRFTATELLGRLPDTAYGRRMVARAREAVRVGRTGGVTVNPPTECDPGMRRDGIAPSPPAGTGERAWWLEEILSRTPLSTWDISMVEADVDDRWAGALRRGLVRAAVGAGDSRWAYELLGWARGDGTRAAQADAQRLLPALAPAELAALAERALRQAPDQTPGLDQMLSLCPAPWSPDLARAVLHALATLLVSGKSPALVESVCRFGALRLAPSLAESVAALAAAHADLVDAYRLRPVERLAGTLNFRSDMIKELA
jgi:hypothetical protein